MELKIPMREVVGGGYDDFWKSKKRYVVCKGSRASKKSTTAALKVIVRIMQMPLANALVVRQTQATLLNSCYAQLKWAINRLGVEKYWKATINPLQLTFLPTGQKILFRGLDDGLKITSITVEKGHLCFVWLEEAFEVSEKDFQFVDESLRGKLPEGYYIQWLVTLNPWSSSCWIKARFFDNPDENTLALTTTYKCNEFLSDEDRELYEQLRKTDPDRAKVACDGDWGIESGQYFSVWRDSLHIVKPFEIPKDWLKFRSMDFGQARPYAVVWFAIDFDGNMYAYRELYGWGGKPNVGTGETAKQIGEKILEYETRAENLRYGVLDSACWARTGVTGPTIAEEINNVLIRKGLVAFMPSSKGRLEGANAFKQRLIGNQLEDGNYKPAIKFFSTCIHCIRTIPMIGHDKHKPELPDTDSEDHCFIAGTLIRTARGEIPIEEVTTADKTLTRKGYQKVLAAGITKRNTEVVTVIFSDGKSLTGTPNHPIFIKGKGFVTLDAVKYGDIIYSASEVDEPCRENKHKQQNRLYSTALLSGDTLTRKTEPIEIITAPTGVSIVKVSFIYTEKFGSLITVKSRKGIMFIIETKILLIMIFLIWSYVRSSTIFQNTSRRIFRQKKDTNVLKHIWTLFDRKPPSGTGLPKGENGTANMGLNVQNANHKNLKSNAYVSNVEKNFTRQVTAETTVNTAQMHVVRNTGAITGWTTKQGFVSSVGRSLELIAIGKPKPVAENAVFVVGLRKEKRKADVYNLTVDEEHEYFANGFLVHNCYDACAYACLSRPFLPVKKDWRSKIRDGWAKEEKERSVWTL